MKVSLKYVQVFGTKCPNSIDIKLDDKEKLIEIKDFPDISETTLIFLEDPIKEILEANKIGDALWGALAKNIFRGRIPKDTDIESELSALEENPELADKNWYITIIIERKIEVQDKKIYPDKYLWLDSVEVWQLEKEFRKYASIYLDMIFMYLSSEIQDIFLSDKIIDGVFFSADEKQTFKFPHLQFRGFPVTVFTGKSVDYKKLERLMKNIKRHNWLDWFKIVSNFRRDANEVDDVWKAFFLNFLALEILTNEMSDSFYYLPQNYNFITFSNTIKISNPSLDLQQSEYTKTNKKKRSLRGNFMLMSYGLFPSDAESDLQDFIEIKGIRNDLSHGNIIEEDKLVSPNSKLNALLIKYLKAVLSLK